MELAKLPAVQISSSETVHDNAQWAAWAARVSMYSAVLPGIASGGGDPRCDLDARLPPRGVLCHAPNVIASADPGPVIVLPLGPGSTNVVVVCSA